MDEKITAPAPEAPAPETAPETTAPAPEAPAPETAKAEGKSEGKTQGKTEAKTQGKSEAKTQGKAEGGGILEEKKGAGETPKDEKGEIDYAKVELGVEGIDPAIAGKFADVAKEIGLAPEQMQKLAQWQAELATTRREELTRAGMEQLKAEYGPRFDPMRRDAAAMIHRIDDAMGGGFCDALHDSGALCDPRVARGFMMLAQSLAEDSLGTSAEGATQLRQESALDGMRAVFGKK